MTPRNTRTLPEVVQKISAWSNIVLDDAGKHCVGNQPAQHCLGQYSREGSSPDEDDWDDHEGWRCQGTNDVYVAGGHVEDAVEEVESWCKQRGLAAVQHLVRAL